MGLSFPLGIDDFAKIREENFYYVDKTAFIKELLNTQKQFSDERCLEGVTYDMQTL